MHHSFATVLIYIIYGVKANNKEQEQRTKRLGRPGLPGATLRSNKMSFPGVLFLTRNSDGVDHFKKNAKNAKFYAKNTKQSAPLENFARSLLFFGPGVKFSLKLVCGCV
jgi:hypothetical protein